MLKNPFKLAMINCDCRKSKIKRSGAEVAPRGARHDRAPHITRDYFYYLDKVQNLVVRENGRCQKIRYLCCKKLVLQFFLPIVLGVGATPSTIDCE